MDIFLTLLLKLIPLYVIIFLGFIAGKFLHVKKESVASLVIYLIAPVIFFNGVLTTTISVSSLFLPVIIFGICCFICLLFFLIGSLFWKDSTRNMLAFISPEANTGYFGLPVALLLLPTHLIGLYIFASLGLIAYESTLGFFIAARGQHTIQESLIKLLKLPLIYSVLLGLIANLLHVHFGPWYLDIVNNVKGAFTILGMMIIGLGIASITEYTFDFLFMGLAFLAKFLVWPLLVAIFIVTDSMFFKVYNHDVYRIVILIAILPIAANTVSYATFLKSHPEKVAITVLLSTLLALFYVPFIAVYFLR